MEDTLEAPIGPVNTPNKEEKQKAAETKTFEIKYEEQEFEMLLSLYDNSKGSYIEFKLIQKDTIPSSYYLEKYDLDNINKVSFTFCNNIKEAFLFYCKILQKNKAKLLLGENNIFCLNFKNIINFDEEVEVYLKFKEVKLTKDEILQELIKEVIKLKKEKNINKNPVNNENNMDVKKEINSEIIILNKKYEEKINALENKILENEKKYENLINDIKKDYEKKLMEMNDKIKLLLEDYSNKKEKERIEENKKKEEEKKYTLNDNVNLINNFKFENANNLRNINVVANDLDITHMKSVAVFNIIKDNEIKYDVAYPDNKNGYNIIIYNLLLNKIESKINNAHSNNIHRIKHYFNPSIKAHILLSTSTDQSIKLWNISSNPITNILTMNNCFDGDNYSPFCLLFKKNDYFILGGSRNQKKKIWNQNGILIGNIEKSNLDYGRFIETAYLDNKTYVLFLVIITQNAGIMMII